MQCMNYWSIEGLGEWFMQLTKYWAIVLLIASHGTTIE